MSASRISSSVNIPYAYKNLRAYIVFEKYFTVTVTRRRMSNLKSNIRNHSDVAIFHDV
jgi:hypothetical protein